MLLSDGDITKLPWIRGNVIVGQAEPYLKRQVERRAVETAILGYFGIKLFQDAKIERNQAIGENCKNKDIDECRALFGAALNQVCRTCPD